MDTKKKSYDKVVALLAILIAIFGVIALLYPIFMWLTACFIILVCFYIIVHADIFSKTEVESSKWKVYRYLCLFSLVVTLAILVGSYFLKFEGNADDQKVELILLIFVAVFGNLAPKIAFNQLLGVRWPWALSNELTWRYTHRIQGYFTIPCVCFMVFGYVFQSVEFFMTIFCIWIFVPGFLSFRYNQKRKRDEKERRV